MSLWLLTVGRCAVPSIKAILAPINNRDIAIYIWLAVSLTLILLIRDFRKSLKPLARMILFSRLTPYFITMVGYISVLIYVTYKIQIWNIGMLKDTIYWFLGIAVILSIRVNNALTEEHYFRKVVLENLQVVALLEFILNFYVFSLIGEIVLVFVTSLLAILIVFFGSNDKYARAKKVCQWLLALIGIFVLIHALVQLITNFHSIFVFENLKLFLLPIVLTILFIPFVYVATVYAAYDELFSRLKMFAHNKTLARFTIWQIAKIARLRISRVKLFSRKFDILAGTADDRDQVMEIIAKYKYELRGK